MAIEVKNITKAYGKQYALNNVSFSIKKGEIVGFLGPNGAGKTTLMKIISGSLEQTSGIILINNRNLSTQKIETQKIIGYLPEQNPLYEDMFVKEYLLFNARLHKIPKNSISEIIKKVGLTSEVHKKIRQLSKGYKQRVGLAAALLHNPEVLLLDEPTTGLDPNQLIEIRNLIKELGKEKTILFSTHIMQEVEAICDRVLLINKGNLVADKNLSLLKETDEQIIEVEFDRLVEVELLNKLPYLNKTTALTNTTWLLVFKTSKDIRSNIFDFAQENGLKTLKIAQKNKTLESLFKELTS